MSNYLMPATYLLYVGIGVSLTAWVARTLRVHGRVLLDRACQGNKELSQALSQLSSVGFYLLHIGFVLLALKWGGRAAETVDAIELLSTKIGFILLLLAASHFIYLAVFSKMHGRSTQDFENYDHSLGQLREAIGH